jgi:polysaccharide export outer membrane protein
LLRNIRPSDLNLFLTSNLNNSLPVLEKIHYLRGLLKRVNMRTRLLFYTLSTLILASCASPEDFYYLRNAGNEKIADQAIDSTASNPTIAIGDQLSIVLTSANLELNAIINASNFGGMPNGGAQGASTTGGYIVDENGEIEFPKVGKMKVAGKKMNSVQKELEVFLADYVKEPTVAIRRLNFRVTILGEVGRPGIIQVSNDRLNILQAIAQAGDLTIFGQRENILLVRETPEGKETVRLSLYDKAILSSPYYWLQNGDLLYVQPNKTKVNTNTTFFQVWPTIISSLSIFLVIFNQITR